MYECILKTWQAMYGVVGFDPPVIDVLKGRQVWQGTINREIGRICVYCGEQSFKIDIRNRYGGRSKGEFIETYDGLFYEVFPSMDPKKYMIIKLVAFEKRATGKSISSIQREGLRREYHGNG